MQIICVSMGTYGGTRDLAQSLSGKMGYPCLCREDLIEAATREGIQVGKLEMAMVKAGRLGRKVGKGWYTYTANGEKKPV